MLISKLKLLQLLVTIVFQTHVSFNYLNEFQKRCSHYFVLQHTIYKTNILIKKTKQKLWNVSMAIGCQNEVYDKKASNNIRL